MIMILKYIEWLGLARDMKRYQTVDDFKGDAKPNHLYKFYPDGAVCSDAHSRRIVSINCLKSEV